MRGWANYFSYGTRSRAYLAVDRYVAERVRHFLGRRQQIPSRGTRRYPAERIFGELGVIQLRQAVSKVCEEHDVSPTLFYAWQRQFFENGAAAFAKEASAEQRDLERQVEALRQRLTQKDRIIAKVTEEFVKTKKELGELERRVGSPRHAGRRDRLRGHLERADRAAGYAGGRVARAGCQQVLRLEAALREGE